LVGIEWECGVLKAESRMNQNSGAADALDDLKVQREHVTQNEQH
jgi:hypothetical protein